MNRIYIGGPRDGQTDNYPSAVPPQEIHIYADPPAGLVCADEQVIDLLGKYVRTGPQNKKDGMWSYEWRPLADPSLQVQGSQSRQP